MMEATPTLVAHIGRDLRQQRIDERTIAWLAKLATARNTMAPV